MMTMLIKYDTFSEEVSRFYIVETILAIDSINKMGFIHRYFVRVLGISSVLNLDFSDIKPDNLLIDKDGHIKLSDFGLCTGFHRTHDSSYYQELLDPKTRRQSADVPRVNLSRRDMIATWKRSRRAIVRHSLFASYWQIYGLTRRILLWVPRIILLQKCSCKRGMAVNVTGGLLARSCLKCSSDIPHFAQNIPMRRIKKFLIGKKSLDFRTMYTLAWKRRT